MRWRVHAGVVILLLAFTACTSTTGATPATDATMTLPSSPTTEPPTTTTMAPTPTTSVDPVPPLLPGDYAAVAFGAWRFGDADLLARLTTDLAYRLLVDRPPTDADRWSFTACRAVLGNTYCAWTGTSDVLSLRVDNDAADEGLPAVIDVRFTSTG